MINIPITIEEFNKDNKTVGSIIIGFLAEHPDEAFKLTELAEKLKIKRNSLNAFLSGFKIDGKVIHKRPYWTINKEFKK